MQGRIWSEIHKHTQIYHSCITSRALYHQQSRICAHTDTPAAAISHRHSYPTTAPALLQIAYSISSLPCSATTHSHSSLPKCYTTVTATHTSSILHNHPSHTCSTYRSPRPHFNFTHVHHDPIHSTLCYSLDSWLKPAQPTQTLTQQISHLPSMCFSRDCVWPSS